MLHIPLQYRMPHEDLEDGDSKPSSSIRRTDETTDNFHHYISSVQGKALSEEFKRTT